MKELFSQLIPIIVALGFVYWWRKVDTSDTSPFKASLFYFFTAVAFIFQMFWYTAETIRIFCGGCASVFIFVSAVHLVTYDSEKYQRKASGWVDGMLGLMAVTGVLMLALDYSNTKSLLNVLIVGFVSGYFGAVLDARRIKRRKGKICNFSFL